MTVPGTRTPPSPSPHRMTDTRPHRRGCSYTLTGADGQPYHGPEPGTLGGHRRGRIYGRLDCPVALRAIETGGYVTERVFFADQQTALAAGYRPCGVCMPSEYDAWKRAATCDHSP